ncbi:Pentatricopeptide repeat-containing protein [Acorus gramineus]|uniref:Pentatricopeptide repeat-containing protein n=1 Tax=Acorus gramineus TaxID=55184 RepID=A0AAV9AJK0_ACOGR|nr:Pentatricopeptide repeat-containing protein [Acorus gramineus]
MRWCDPLFKRSELFLQILQNPTKSKPMQHLHRSHQLTIVHGLQSDPFITTRLVQLYFYNDDLRSASHLFDTLPHPNVFAWTSLLAFHSRHARHHDCLLTYSHMRSVGVAPDGYVFPTVLRSCARSGSLEHGTMVHADVFKFGLDVNLKTCNSMIDMYSKCGDLKDARRVFDAMVRREVLSWNSMLSGYVGVGSVDLAVAMVGSMGSDGLEPDSVTWNTVMDGYCRAGRCMEAEAVLCQMAEPSVVSWTTVMLGYSRAGDHETALRVFERMIGGLVKPDCDALSCVLSSCRHLGALKLAREIHGFGLKTASIDVFYSSAGAALVAIYASHKRVRDAENVFALMNDVDVVTWNAIVHGFAQSGMESSALEYFREMQFKEVASDPTSIASVLPISDIKLGKQIHAHAIKKFFASDIEVWNALISMYAKAGSVETARSVFSGMVDRDVVSWNAMIGGYGANGHGVPAIRLLEEMGRAGVNPNTVTFTCALSACARAGLVEEGLDLFERMRREFALEPTREQFACVVDALARAGRVEEAIGFVGRMGGEAEGSIWGAVLSGCRIHEDVEIGGLAAENLFRLEPENAGNYVTYSEMLVRAGRLEDAKRVRRLMESRGLVKPTGSSWIDAKK